MKEQLLKLQEVFTKAKGISIELGLIQALEEALKDTNKFNNMAEDWVVECDKELDVADKLKVQLKNIRKSFSSLIKKSEKLDASADRKSVNVKHIEEQLKGLGIKVPKEVEQYKRAEKELEKNGDDVYRVRNIIKQYDFE